MKKIYLSILFLSVITINLKAQWNWLYTANYSNRENGEKIVFDDDGNMFVLSNHNSGNFQSGGGYWYYRLSKFDSNRNFLWEKPIAAYGICVRSLFIKNKSIYIHGSYGGGDDPHLIPGKVGPPGGAFFLVWDEEGNFIRGNYIYNSPYGMGGWEKGNLMSYDGSIYYEGNFSTKFALDSDTIVNTNYIGTIFIKFDDNFNIIWYKSFKRNWSSSYAYMETTLYGFSDKLILTSDFSDTVIVDNNLLTSLGGGYDGYILCLDTMSNFQWQRRLGRSLSGDDFNASCIDNIGCIYIAGRSYYGPVIFDTDTLYSNNSSFRYLAKYNINGIIQWAKPIQNYYNEISVQNGNLIGLIYDTLNGNKFFEKMDTAGNSIQMYYALNAIGYDIKYISSDTYLMTGGFAANSPFGTPYEPNPNCYNWCNWQDYFIVEQKETVLTLNTSEVLTDNNFQIFPNPTTGEFVVSSSKFGDKKINIYNTFGKIILQQTLNSKLQTLNLSSEAKGIYFLELTSGEKREMKKIVLN